MRSEERARSEASSEGRESPTTSEATPTAQQLAPYKVQIIDVLTRTDGIRPYSVYVILVRKEGGEWDHHTAHTHTHTHKRQTLTNCVIVLYYLREW